MKDIPVEELNEYSKRFFLPVKKKELVTVRRDRFNSNQALMP